ncbi:MAG: DUF4350 domain-containing protein [Roseibacillus sp.]
MRVRDVIFVSLSFLLVGCGKFEESEREVGYQGEAKMNHLLGAERLANELGMKASSYAGAPSLPPAAGTTLMLPAESLQSVGQLSEIEDWVVEGGNLIVYLTLKNKRLPAWDEDEGAEPFRAFLDYFALDAQQAGGEKEEGKNRKISSLGFEEDDEYETDFETPYLILDDESLDEELKAFHSYSYGEGNLTVLASAQLFTNEFIGKGEHATLLWHLLEDGKEEQVWFIHSARLSFTRLLWQQAPYAVVMLLVTLVLLVWWAARGFGPKFVRGANPSAKLDAHLEASGAFFVKHGADALVVSQLQGRLFRRLARALNQPLNTKEGELLSLADQEGLLDASERGALISQPTSKTLFTTLQTLKNLDKKL